MRILTLTLSALTFGALSAQPFLIGERTITFYDAIRDRNIETVIRYPGETAGANAVVVTGQYPVLVVGHGFAMGVDAYANLWEYFVPKGYIMALPTTEGGLFPAPNHGAFGEDLAFLVDAFQTENLDAASPFFGRVAPASALMGHSMGGGASFLGAAANANIQALVNFAPAETNPSAIAAAATVLAPTLVFAGANDCVTPIAAHQGPMYDALTTTCRAFVNITGASHCQFADLSLTCSFGELTCSPSAAISRAEQHSVINDFAGLWLDHFLKAVPGAFNAVSDSIDLSTRVTTQFTCGITTGLEANEASALMLSPVPANDLLRISNVASNATVHVLDALGREAMPRRVLNGNVMLDVSGLAMGTYRLMVEQEGTVTVLPFVVAR